MLFYTLRHLNRQAAEVSSDPATQHVIVENRLAVEASMSEDRSIARIL